MSLLMKGYHKMCYDTESKLQTHKEPELKPFLVYLIGDVHA
jgi:hypothetical protein